MNRPAEQMTKGAAHRRSFLYSPGAMNPHTWYRIHGDAMKMAVRIGSFTHTILKASMGDIRSIPSSSSPPPESEGGGGDMDPPDPPALAAAGATAVEVLAVLTDCTDASVSLDEYGAS